MDNYTNIMHMLYESKVPIVHAFAKCSLRGERSPTPSRLNHNNSPPLDPSTPNVCLIACAGQMRTPEPLRVVSARAGYVMLRLHGNATSPGLTLQQVRLSTGRAWTPIELTSRFRPTRWQNEQGKERSNITESVVLRRAGGAGGWRRHPREPYPCAHARLPLLLWIR